MSSMLISALACWYSVCSKRGNDLWLSFVTWAHAAHLLTSHMDVVGCTGPSECGENLKS